MACYKDRFKYLHFTSNIEKRQIPLLVGYFTTHHYLIYPARNDRLIDEFLKDLDGSSKVLTDVSRRLPGGTRENHESLIKNGGCLGHLLYATLEGSNYPNPLNMGYKKSYT
jgi:hypothetical protein